MRTAKEWMSKSMRMRPSPTSSGMVIDEITDGKRIGQLLASEIHGHQRGNLGLVAVTDADPDVEPTETGAYAFAVTFDGQADREPSTASRFAAVYIYPEHVQVVFTRGGSTALAAADRYGLSSGSEPAAAQPSVGDVVVVGNGGEVKAALRVFRAVADEILEDAG